MTDNLASVEDWDFDSLNERARRLRSAASHSGGQAVGAALANGELQLDSPREDIDRVYELARATAMLSASVGEPVWVASSSVSK